MSVIAKLYFDGGERTLLFWEEEKKKKTHLAPHPMMLTQQRR